MKGEFEPLITYYPARLYEGKEWYVGFYVIHPGTGQMKRVKRKINRITPVGERRRFGRELVNKINARLAAGWNPFIHQSAPKSDHLLFDALKRFMEVKKSEQKLGGHRSYISMAKILKEWITDQGMQNMLVIAFDRKMAANLMDNIWKVRTNNPSTYNNYLQFYRVFWNWMIEFQYCSASPFQGMRFKRRQQKERKIIPEAIRTQIRIHLEREDPVYLLVCYLVFHTLIRPIEITRLRVRDVNLKNQVIVIPGAAAKSGKMRISTIPNVLQKSLQRYIGNADPKSFLISDSMCPGKKTISERRFRYKWTNLREALDLPMEYKMYSLRDSGIVQKLQDGISPEEVMKQAGHHSLEITTIYVNHVNPRGSEQIKSHTSDF